jgi:hypothetical protein
MTEEKLFLAKRGWDYIQIQKGRHIIDMIVPSLIWDKRN